ncbi:LuxR family two component transcriptional regulator [Asanoa ferruginea]|uniref:LuxR family two component transcriptional regulator n=1 Tax=Asanoa ferruginea TaxID=53367 RepID=A0A3D9ZVE3_9ACTN|nr:response regulator transcription factor [Asanoa ferruginea]REG01168.1 LuxR family two component transcriptional regulator [Asanoa ferruginea]GIF47127.1 DNA-binding response regulator [Asanoa ferruginea]
MEPIRILLADDHPVFRYGIRAVLASDPRSELVGEAGNGDEAVAKAAELAPDVVLMDLTMPGLNGVEATRRIVAARPQTNVLVVTMFDDSASVLAAVRAGARGYLVKGADRDEILRAVHAAAAGEAIFSPAAAQHLAAHLAAPRPTPAWPAFPGLTAREHEILVLMASGLTNTAIAERFRLSPKTVRNYVSTIIAKLEAETRAEAITRARAAGIAEPDG